MMRKAILLLAVVALACSIHLQSIEHTLRDMTQEHEITIPTHLARDYNAIRQSYLRGLPQGPSVDGQKAYQMADFFGTPMGNTILKYFDSMTVQADGRKGLNRYNLSDKNFRLWMSIKIIAGPDTNMYARSIAGDKDLFIEFVDRTMK